MPSRRPLSVSAVLIGCERGKSRGIPSVSLTDLNLTNKTHLLARFPDCRDNARVGSLTAPVCDGLNRGVIVVTTN